MPSTDTAPADGRLARGERRRAELIAATLRIVERDGAAGVTHRTVAAEAAASGSLVTYYFATLDDLVVAAYTHVSEHYEHRLRAALEHEDDPLDGLAALLADSGTDVGRGRALAERELATLAARRPALRGLAQGWRAAVADIARARTDDPTTVTALIAAADGLCASVLLGEIDPDVAAIRAVLEHVVRAAPTGGRAGEHGTRP